jgi:predicted protein tyrosine phosphatase
MLNNIDLLAASQFEAMHGISGLVVVSITDPGSSVARVPVGFGPILRLKFDDLDESNMATGSTGKVFSATDARAVVSFLDEMHQSQNVKGLLVHCEMGRSRSAAIAWYALVYGGRLTRKRRIDGINLLVLSQLEEAGGRCLPRPTKMQVPAGFRMGDGSSLEHAIAPSL